MRNLKSGRVVYVALLCLAGMAYCCSLQRDAAASRQPVVGVMTPSRPVSQHPLPWFTPGPRVLESTPTPQPEPKAAPVPAPAPQPAPRRLMLWVDQSRFFGNEGSKQPVKGRFTGRFKAGGPWRVLEKNSSRLAVRFGPQGYWIGFNPPPGGLRISDRRVAAQLFAWIRVGDEVRPMEGSDSY